MGKKLFDFAIGNPPYQSGDNESNSRQEPIYPIFMMLQRIWLIVISLFRLPDFYLMPV